jgi:hypothetical protein
MNERDANNLEFINFTLNTKGTREFTAWFEQQETYIQEDVVRLLNYQIVEMTDELVGHDKEYLQARLLLNKFTLAKI